MMAEPNGTARGREADPFRMGRIEVPKQFRKAPIGVFWDIEQCQLPALCNGGEIVEKIKSTVSSLGYKGQVHIIIIGDTNFISPDVDDDLQSAGIKFRYIHGEMGRTGVHVFSEMVDWLWGVTGPANILFISKISEQRCLMANTFSGFPPSDYNFIQKSLTLGTVDVAKYLWDWSEGIGQTFWMDCYSLDPKYVLGEGTKVKILTISIINANMPKGNESGGKRSCITERQRRPQSLVLKQVCQVILQERIIEIERRRIIITTHISKKKKTCILML